MATPRHARLSPRPRLHRQSGVYAIMFIPLLIVLLSVCGLAVDLGQVYNRMVDLHGMARAAAIAAAHELNGTAAGITAAQSRAKSTAESLRYKYFASGTAFTWNDAALTFSTDSSRAGTWIGASSTSGKEATLFYVKVDTAALDAGASAIETFFIRIFAPSLGTITIGDSVIAGRTAINVAPIGVCAMGVKAATRSYAASGVTLTELVQYGFRRGVSYDLMQLNPNGTSPVRFVVNPVAAPGTSSASFNTATLSQFMCTGSMWVPRVTGGTIRVSSMASTSPLASYSTYLNARFDVFSGGTCDPNGAPPDFNVKSYAYDVASTVKWMSPGTGSAAALSTTTRGKLETVADLATPPASAGDFGPLWAYAKAVKAPSPVDADEPAAGYASFSTSDWPTIYKSGPTASGYPLNPATPYTSTSTSSGNYVAPSAADLEISTSQRRVLNLPLLDCSSGAPAGSNVPATVLAIGKFFMTVPATSDNLITEFAGVLPDASLSSRVEVFP